MRKIEKPKRGGGVPRKNQRPKENPSTVCEATKKVRNKTEEKTIQ